MTSMMGAGGDGPDKAIESCGERLGALGLERSDGEIWKIFEGWMAQFGKNYDSLAEKDWRFQIFKEKFLYIERHNRDADAGIHSYRQGLNLFSDLTSEEFRKNFFRLCSS